MKLTAVDLATALGLEGISMESDALGISFDSRTLVPKDLFFALKGEGWDGHDYIHSALEKGAAAVICERTIPGLDSEKLIIVPCALTALEKIGVYERNQSASLNIAVTGSVGKTTTKSLLNHVLQNFGETVASQGTFNNHIGVPFSLCSLTPTTRYGIFEAGMDNPGEIAPLSCLISPKIAIVTNIAPSHIGRMGSIEAIAMEKGDIVAGLPKDGTVILPFDTPQYPILLEKAKTHGLQHILTFGKTKGATAQLLSFTPHPSGEGSDISVSLGGKIYTFSTHCPGEHSATNMALALLTAHTLGLKPEDVIPHLSSFKPISGRGQRWNLRFDNKNITLIDDAYNANPTSMRAGLSVLQSIPTQGRRIAILGDMLSLGEDSAEYHRSVGELIKSMPIDLVFAAGPEMKYLFDALGTTQKVLHTQTAEELLPHVLSELQDHDVILVKGSKGSYVSKIVTALLKKQELAA